MRGELWGRIGALVIGGLWKVKGQMETFSWRGNVQ